MRKKDFDLEKITTYLKKTRESQGLKGREVAKKIGVSLPYLYMLENNEHHTNLSLGLLFSWCSALNLHNLEFQTNKHTNSVNFAFFTEREEKIDDNFSEYESLEHRRKP
jgi:transcriptional regulator with XRE-family HTH domain